MGIGVSDGARVADGGTGVSVEDGIASGVGEEQETRRIKMKEERRRRNVACVCMGGL